MIQPCPNQLGANVDQNYNKQQTYAEMIDLNSRWIAHNSVSFSAYITIVSKSDIHYSLA
jgi:hypothetical protein